MYLPPEVWTRIYEYAPEHRERLAEVHAELSTITETLRSVINVYMDTPSHKAVKRLVRSHKRAQLRAVARFLYLSRYLRTKGTKTRLVAAIICRVFHQHVGSVAHVCHVHF